MDPSRKDGCDETRRGHTETRCLLSVSHFSLARGRALPPPQGSCVIQPPKSPLVSRGVYDIPRGFRRLSPNVHPNGPRASRCTIGRHRSSAPTTGAASRSLPSRGGTALSQASSGRQRVRTDKRERRPSASYAPSSGASRRPAAPSPVVLSNPPSVPLAGACGPSARPLAS